MLRVATEYISWAHWRYENNIYGSNGCYMCDSYDPASRRGYQLIKSHNKKKTGIRPYIIARYLLCGDPRKQVRHNSD